MEEGEDEKESKNKKTKILKKTTYFLLSLLSVVALSDCHLLPYILRQNHYR